MPIIKCHTIDLFICGMFYPFLHTFYASFPSFFSLKAQTQHQRHSFLLSFEFFTVWHCQLLLNCFCSSHSRLSRVIVYYVAVCKPPEFSTTIYNVPKKKNCSSIFSYINKAADSIENSLIQKFKLNASTLNIFFCDS